MVEYTVDTLVHLYDSLNDQIEQASYDLREFHSTCIDPNLTDWYRTQIEQEQKRLENRINHLRAMRENIERLLSSILSAAVKEAE